jgi:hypothetical protein
MKYYLGGYYLIKLQPKEFGVDSKNLIYTCSNCLNNNLVDAWSYSWTAENDKQAIEAKEIFNLSDSQLISIRTWVDRKHNEDKIGGLNVFTDIETVIEYKAEFFSHLSDIKIIALYFDEAERKDLLEEFKPKSETFGEIGLRLTLLKEIEETESEMFLGYDYIGIESSGDFHTFHCHDLSNEFPNKFKLSVNSFGLFENNNSSKQVLDYLNDETNGCEPVPWYIAKIKLLSTQ